MFIPFNLSRLNHLYVSRSNHVTSTITPADELIHFIKQEVTEKQPPKTSANNVTQNNPFGTHRPAWFFLNPGGGKEQEKREKEKQSLAYKTHALNEVTRPNNQNMSDAHPRPTSQAKVYPPPPQVPCLSCPIIRVITSLTTPPTLGQPSPRYVHDPCPTCPPCPTLFYPGL